MKFSNPRPCAEPGCHWLVRGNVTWCEQHKRQPMRLSEAQMLELTQNRQVTAGWDKLSRSRLPAGSAWWWR